MTSVNLNSRNLDQGLYELNAPEAVTELNCSNDPQIHTLPRGIEKLIHLQYLNLSNTGIKNLPDNMAEFRELKVLDLRGTPITHLPKALLESDHPLTIILLGCDKAVRSNFKHHSRLVTLVFPE